MAFTPDGMFYLSKEDYAPTMDTLGGAVRGMFGVQNKEEAINSILKSADYNTPEGRQAALSQIKAIDPTAWEKFNKMNQEYELESLSKKAYAQQVEIQNKSLQLKQDEIEAQKRVPKLGNWWDRNKKQSAINSWLKLNQPEDALKDVDWDTMTDAKAKALLRKIHKGGAGQQINSMEAALLQERNSHISNNKFNPDALTSDETLKDASSLFGGESANTKPPLSGVPINPPAWKQDTESWHDSLPSDEIY